MPTLNSTASYVIKWGTNVSAHFTSGKRISIAENIELIQDAHPSVNPIRSDLRFTFYAWPRLPEFGFFASYQYGHDNYNFRFVDSGHQVALGITWSIFPPVAMRSNKLIKSISKPKQRLNDVTYQSLCNIFICRHVG